ncbi:hypothetical protein BDZ94DRAFT_1236936 [Collybia nuda]|uniref:BZIP domain-containing protein n=1 Tax=Collybia nuda TaxID=64659 RepID=A0A9P5Y2X6_9AGAR|nr:hypothetical protein BDZ94DRAFT_1236936 [Collybia nuda]
MEPSLRPWSGKQDPNSHRDPPVIEFADVLDDCWPFFPEHIGEKLYYAPLTLSQYLRKPHKLQGWSLYVSTASSLAVGGDTCRVPTEQSDGRHSLQNLLPWMNQLHNMAFSSRDIVHGLAGDGPISSKNMILIVRTLLVLWAKDLFEENETNCRLIFPPTHHQRRFTPIPLSIELATAGMPPNLQGLNIVHPAQTHSDSHDLLSGQSYPDLSAQLDLWTNLAFESDDGPLSAKIDDDRYRTKSRHEEEEDDGRSHGSGTGEAAIHDGHVNVVTGTNLGSNVATNNIASQHTPAFDLNSFLAGFGIDPFSPPPIPNSHQPTTIAPSLAQLIALHSTQGTPYVAPAPPPEILAGENKASIHSTDDSYPVSKRSRTRKSSISTVSSPEAYREETPNPLSHPISAAEDKRRRNTAASARFRLKKKEREAALEGKAKELEGRVNELERECEGLRRENGWLKGLVVGVTGAAQGPVSTGTKRTRDELENA